MERTKGTHRLVQGHQVSLPAAAWTSFLNISVTFVLLVGIEGLSFMFPVQCSHRAPSDRIHHMQILGRMVTTG